MNLFAFLRRRKPIPEPWAKYYTKEELNIKIPDISMYDQVKKSSYLYPNYIAYEYMGRKCNYQNFIKEINAYAKVFTKAGVKHGDIVTIMLPNMPNVLVSLYALNKIGAIANMVHPLSSEEEILFSLTSTKSKHLIMLNTFYTKIENIIDKTDVKEVIFASASDYMPFFLKVGYNLSQIGKYKKHPKRDKYLSWKGFYKKYYSTEYIKFPKFGKDTPAVIIHSGGTSGTPKNVVIQNRAFILGALQEKISMKNLHAGDCCLAIMPNFHGFGLSVLMHTPLALGCYSILIPQFDAKKFDIMFHKKNPSCVLGVPTLYEALMSNNNVKNLDLSNLKYIVSGGDILPKSLENKMNEYLKEHNSLGKITQGYGLSEALAAVCLACDDVNKSGSVGIPLAGNQVKIIDPATRETLKYGDVGEICVHSKAFMQGYLNDESETNTALQVHKDGHVWLHTGDLGYMDEDGFVFYKGRLKRMIVSSGYNVYPSHVEEVIESHPAVLQCTVVGVPHPYKQEVPKAFIVLKEGYIAMFVKDDIKAYCKKKLSKYMIPAEFVFRKRLPKTKLGKVDFKSLQKDTRGDYDE
jgi:AMP-dependent synthetase/ligase